MHDIQRTGAHRAEAVHSFHEGSVCSGHRALGEHRPRLMVFGRRLCAVCGERVGTLLRALPRLYDDCEEALGPAQGGLKQRVSGSRSTGMTLNVRAADARADMVGLLVSWAGLVVAERNTAAPGGRTVRDLAGFVEGHLDWLLAHPAAEDFVSEIAEVESAARRAVDGTEAPQELGSCVRPNCASPVRVSARLGAGSEVSCGAGHVLPPHQWLLLGGRGRS